MTSTALAEGVHRRSLPEVQSSVSDLVLLLSEMHQESELGMLQVLQGAEVSVNAAMLSETDDCVYAEQQVTVVLMAKHRTPVARCSTRN
jgi:hypothetical protein